MTLEEARKIKDCNGLGYSTIDFIKALRVIEDYYEELRKNDVKEENK